MKFLFLLLTSFILSAIIIPIQISKFKKKGWVVPDYYKRDLRMIPTSGGLSVLFVLYIVFFMAFVLNIFFPDLFPGITRLDLKALIVISFFGFFGLLDDFTDVGRVTKIFLPFTFSLPIITELNFSMVTLPFLGNIDLGWVYLLVIVPTYIMVTANLVNMHSGFNGMASGLTAIILGFLLLKSLKEGRDTIFMLSCVTGAVLGFLLYNKYPSKIFDGNVGALLFGSSIGLGIVANNFLVSGFVMLIPHTLNFLMYVYWRIMRKINPKDEKWRLVKFGRVREDGTLEVPNNLTLKWLFPYYFRLTEKQVVLIMYLITLIFCIIGFFIPY